ALLGCVAHSAAPAAELGRSAGSLLCGGARFTYSLLRPEGELVNTYLLAGLAWCVCSADPDQLLKQLDEDFEAALKSEKDPQPLRKAAQLLQETNQSD